MPPVKLVAVDIDGTLLNSQFRISEANLRALAAAHEAGICVVLATGRRQAFALPIARMLGFDPYIISSNGAMTCTPGGEVMAKELMAKQVALALLDHMQAFAGMAVLTFDREGKGALVVQSRAGLMPRLGRWLEKNEPYIIAVDPIQRSLTEAPMQMMFCGTIEQMESAIAHLAKASVAQQIHAANTRYEQRDLSILDVLPRGCTKGRALARLSRHLGISAGQVLAIGDNGNDREMLEFAGQAFVMANAVEEIKGFGWTLTHSNDEDGVAYALDLALRAEVEA